jgi:hypothetical protein
VRSFDPVLLGGYEAAAWVAYYRRRWGAFLRASLGLIREGFGLPLTATVHGAWYVMRASQAWAPYPTNDSDAARAYMRRFYALVADRNHETFDPDEAARKEVEWWRIHRVLQRGGSEPSTDHAHTQDDLTDALASLYAHLYGVSIDTVRGAAAHRAEAMRISDAWFTEGADASSPAIAAERDELVKGYALLRAAVG